MVAVGRAGAEADLKLKDWSNCTAGEACFKVNSPSLAMVGTNAGAFGAGTGLYPGGGLGSFCVVFEFGRQRHGCGAVFFAGRLFP